MRSLGTITGVALAVAFFVTRLGLARGAAAVLDSAWNTRGTDVVIHRGRDGQPGVLDPPRDAGAHGRRRTSPHHLAGQRGFGGGRRPAARGLSAQGFDPVAGRAPGRTNRARSCWASAGPNACGWHPSMRCRCSSPSAGWRVGLVVSPSLLARNLVIADLVEVQALTFRTRQATSINVRLSPGLDDPGRQQALARLRAAVPVHAAEGTEQVSQGLPSPASRTRCRSRSRSWCWRCSTP